MRIPSLSRRGFLASFGAAAGTAIVAEACVPPSRRRASPSARRTT